ncbi:F-box domain-containing protein [Mycena venus]|uniref:F-box domain-containing protein n=1 Tax=Mycena venus TaxID=2733690 RepID=A0A8H6Y137_9AGAR|nr:F-box domain-containing protein [Mycena venus]
MAHACWKCGALPLNASQPGFLPATTGNSLDFTQSSEGNAAPLDSDIPFIRNIISKGLAHVDTLDIQIRDLEAALAELVRRREEMVERVRQHRVILSPVRRLPPELVCDIFTLTLNTDEVTPHKFPGILAKSADPGDSPLWRILFCGAPSLSLPPHSRSGDLSMTKTQLLRSANAPLKVYWVVNAGHTMDPQMADLVVAECSRWAALRLDVVRAHSSDVLNWLRPVNGRLSSLKKLELFVKPNVVVPDVFSTAPSLRKVYLTDWPFQQISPNISIPWRQITHYRGAYAVQSQLHILRRSPNLLQCAVGLDDALDSHSHASIILPHLRRLCIQVAAFLVHLTTPLLEDLYYVDGSTTGLHKLLPFVHRSACSLRKLVLMECDISLELLTVLRGLPTLRDFFIEVEFGQDQALLFDAMKISGTSNDLCPNLTSFSYGVDKEFPQDVFFAMVESRRNRGLTRLLVFDPNDYLESGSAGVASSIRKLREEGMDAVFLGEDDGDVELLKAENFF